MLKHRPLIGFLLRLVLIYGILVCPWPGVSHAYLACFAAAGNVLFSSVGSVGSVRFESGATLEDPWATTLVFRNERTAAEGRLERCSARPGYLMTALVVALILATPVPWPRRLRAMFLGILVAGAIQALTLWLSLVNVFSDNTPIMQFVFSPAAKKALALAVRILSLSPEVPFAVPVLIWIAVTIRRHDLSAWTGRPASHRGPAGPGPRS